MTGWLFDTDALSAFAPHRARPNPVVVGWFERHKNGLYMSVVSVAEIQGGISKLRRDGATQRAREMQTWADDLLDTYRERVLDLDLETARALGDLLDHARASGRDPGFADLALAATAKAHGLVLMTRNQRHFRDLGIEIIYPFDPKR